jgi:hypothetical protein
LCRYPPCGGGVFGVLLHTISKVMRTSVKPPQRPRHGRRCRYRYPYGT